MRSPGLKIDFRTSLVDFVNNKSYNDDMSQLRKDNENA